MPASCSAARRVGALPSREIIMRVTMKTGLCGPDLSIAAGEPYDASDEEGQRLIDADLARLPDGQAAPSAKSKAKPKPAAA